MQIVSIHIKCQILLPKKIKKNITSLSSTEFVHSIVSVNVLSKIDPEVKTQEY